MAEQDPQDEIATRLQQRSRALRARHVKIEATVAAKERQGQDAEKSAGWVERAPRRPRWERRDGRGIKGALAVRTESGLSLTDAVLLTLYENGPNAAYGIRAHLPGEHFANLNFHLLALFREGMISRREIVEERHNGWRKLYLYRLTQAGLKRLRERLEQAAFEGSDGGA